MIRIILLAIFVVAPVALHAQSTHKLDSLQNILKKGPTNDVKITTYIALSNYFVLNDPKMTLFYADSALEIVNGSPQFKKHFPEIYLLKGVSYEKQSIFSEAIKFFDEGLNYAIQLKDKIREASFYVNLAAIADDTGETAEALELNQKALDIYVGQKNTDGMVEVYNNLGIIYSAKKEHSKAMDYYKKAAALNNATGNSVANARITNNIGLIFQEMFKPDSALVYFKKALSYIDSKRQKYGYALINNNLGISYRYTKQYDLALNHFTIAKQLQTELNDQYGLGLVNENIARVFFAQERYSESLKYLKIALGHAKQTDNLDLLNNIYEHLASSYAKLNDFKNAYLFQKQADAYDDSLHTKSISKEIAEVEVKYQVKQQQVENTLLKKDASLKTELLKNQRYTGLLIVSALLTMLGFVMVVYLRYRKKAETSKLQMQLNLEVANAETERNKAALMLAQEQLSSYTQLLLEKSRVIEDLNEREQATDSKRIDNEQERVHQLNILMQSRLLTEEDWEKFRRLFEKVHPTFFAKLNNSTALTPAETRLIALLKLGLSTKEIATMLCISIQTVYKTRQRLKAKIGNSAEGLLSEIEEVA